MVQQELVDADANDLGVFGIFVAISIRVFLPEAAVHVLDDPLSLERQGGRQPHNHHRAVVSLEDT